jgi:ferric-dicitrate binding protein FerR (iron transport regulator)
MKNTERKIGPGAWEALRRQNERANELPVSEGLEEKIMKEIHSRKASMTLWRRVAAVAVTFLVVSGLSLAAVLIGRNRAAADPEEASHNAIEVYETGEVGTEKGTAVLFEGVRLDSMLNVVARYYGRSVSFADERMKSLKIHTRWNKGETLFVFVESLNELEVVRIVDEHDTLFVKKGGKE